MARAPSVCSRPGCPEIATHAGRCDAHQRKPWANRSAHDQRMRTDPAARRAHRAARQAALKRTGGRCEECGLAPLGGHRLALHHPHRIADGGATVQPDAVLLCPTCHLEADRRAGGGG